MRKFLKLIPIFLAAIVLAVFFVPGLIPTNTAAAEVYPGTTTDKNFENQSMFLEYAGDTLVGIDGSGYVYRAEEGTIDKLVKTGAQLQYVSKMTVDTNTNHNSIGNAYQKLLTYGNNTLLFAGNNGTRIFVYKSIDQGKTWTVSDTGIKLAVSSEGGYPYDLMFENDRFIMYTICNNNGTYRMEERFSLNGETFIYKGKVDICWNINHAGGYIFFSSIVDQKICFSSHFFEDNDPLTGNPSFISIPITDRNFEYGYQSAMTKVGNIYLAITSEGRVFTCTGNLQAWNSIGTIEYKRVVKMYPYESGVICVALGTNEVSSAIFYLEINNNTVSTKLMYTNDFSNLVYSVNHNANYIANTVAISNKHVTVGGNNLYMPRASEDSSKISYSSFTTYTRNITHKVEFRDYNGNLLSSSDVNEGSTPVAPADPSRTGYKFVGWDKDITAAITEDTVFTAVYEANLYNVTFKDEETGDIISTVKVAYNTQIPSDKIPTPTKDGYQFVGWDKDVKSLITGDITFNAKFSKYAYITFTYPVKTGTFGLLQQFHKTEVQSKKIRFTIGEIIENNGDYKSFVAGLNGWIKDFDLDGKWDYDVKFLAWDKQLPTHINEDITVTASYEKLNLVRLVYYSQLRFKIEDDYYYTFISEMNIEKLIETGAKMNVNDFKRADVDYEIYNANRDTFYNNLVGFNFKGWDHDITKPISSDLIVKGIYDLPKFEIRYYDADLYLIETTNNQIDFMGIENLIELLNRDNTYLKQYKHFFKSGIIINVSAINKSIEKLMEKLDVATYIQSLQKYNDKSTRLITPFVVIDSDRPDAYGGIFTSGKIEVDSAVLTPFAGDLQDHDRSYYISPIMFTTSAYPMSATVTFTNKLHSAIKSFNMFFGAIGNFFKTAWNWIWKILIVAGIIALICFILYIFKEPLRRTIDNANKKRIEQKQENQRTKQQLKQSKQNNNHFKSKNFKSTKRKK